MSPVEDEREDDRRDARTISPLLSVEKIKVLVIAAVSGASYSLVRSISEMPGIEVTSAIQVGGSGQGQFGQIQLESVHDSTLSVDHSVTADNAATKHKRDELTKGFDVVLYCADPNSQEALATDIIRVSKIYLNSVIVVITRKLSGYYLELLDSGTIAGILPASYSGKQLLLSLQLIRTGACMLPMEFRGSLGQQQTADHHNKLSVSLSASLAASGLKEKLTPRQIEVLGYVSRGKSNKYIAEELSLCESTVKVHVHEVMKRLGATSRTHASYIFNSLRQSAETSETGAATIQ